MLMSLFDNANYLAALQCSKHGAHKSLSGSIRKHIAGKKTKNIYPGEKSYYQYEREENTFIPIIITKYIQTWTKTHGKLLVKHFELGEFIVHLLCLLVHELSQ